MRLDWDYQAVYWNLQTEWFSIISLVLLRLSFQNVRSWEILNFTPNLWTLDIDLHHRYHDVTQRIAPSGQVECFIKRSENVECWNSLNRCWFSWSFETVFSRIYDNSIYIRRSRAFLRKSFIIAYLTNNRLAMPHPWDPRRLKLNNDCRYSQSVIFVWPPNLQIFLI